MAELAYGERLTAGQLADAGYVGACQTRLLQSVEDGRRYQEWLQGKPLRLEHRGFNRQDGDKGPVLECRADLLEDLPTDGCYFRNPDGSVRRWAGPGAPRPTTAANQ
jgi:hypothetical protein